MREALEIVVATGLPRILGIPLPEVPNFRTFPPRYGGTDRRSLLESSPKEFAADSLTDYVTSCFEERGFLFPREYRNRLGRLVGEVLTNAEDHGNRSGWWVAGYLRQPEDRAYGDLHLTIFNFGSTLAESLQSIERGPFREPIEELIAHHRRRGYFSKSWTEEELWTVFALQEGVTRHLGKPENRSHGVGTTEMIEAFQHLGRTTEAGVEPRMCLLSGHSHLLFLPKHRLEETPDAAGISRKQIAFNQANDLFEPPDPGAVRHLHRFFPGTLISLRFYADRRYLETLRSPDGTQGH